MNNQSLENQVQKMLSVIYQIPMGLIETDFDGNVQQMNAKSVQLLMPLFFSNGLKGNNLHLLLDKIAPELRDAVHQFKAASGTILNQHRVDIAIPGQPDCHFIFTINKLDELNLVYVFDDITELYLKEKELSLAQQDKAVEQSKFEIASGVLHDIGNAVVGFGSYTTRIKRALEQNEIGTLEKLKSFLEKNKESLFTAMGEAKANAMVDLLNGVISNEHRVIAEAKQSIADQLKIISHVQEILSIQRQYVVGKQTERMPVNIRGVINDSVAMLFGTLEKKGIEFHLDAPALSPKIKGDRTQLMQVLLNLLKNAVDAFTVLEQPQKEIKVSVEEKNQQIIVTIRDNGKGFDAITADNIFERGFTTRAEGTGLGLDNCRKIIESHQGSLTLTSAGEGLGATATIIFND